MIIDDDGNTMCYEFVNDKLEEVAKLYMHKTD
jgi:hypothetical protein